jgi:hypothetical protein
MRSYRVARRLLKYRAIGDLKGSSTFEENIMANPLKRIRKTENELFHHDSCYPSEYLIQTVLV